MSSDVEPSNQLRRYINHLLLKMHQSKGDLIKARYKGMENDRELRENLQSDIIEVYTFLCRANDGSVSEWDEILLYEYNGTKVTGLDRIADWEDMYETVEMKRQDLSDMTEQVKQPKVMPKKVLVQACMAIDRVANIMGYKAVSNNRKQVGET